MFMYFIPIILAWFIGVSSPLSLVLLLCTCLVFSWAVMQSGLCSSSLLSCFSFLLWLLSLVFFYTSSLLVLYFCFEFSLLPLVSVLLFFGYSPEKLSSSVYFLVYTIVGGLPLLYFVCLRYHISISCLSSGSQFGLLLVSLAFFIKSPLFYFHSWLPKAHTESPVFGSIILAGVMLKFGGYGILLLSPGFGNLSYVFLYVTLAGGIVCSLVCLRQWDLKAMVAYSSVVHIGTVSVGALSCTEAGRWVSVSIMVSHSLISPILFSLCYEVYCSVHCRSVFNSVFSSSSPSIILVLALCFSINIGTPPFFSFWVEVALFHCLFHGFAVGTFCLFTMSFVVYSFCLVFYLCCFSTGKNVRVGSVWSFLLYVPSLVFSLLIFWSSSLFLV